MVPKNVAEILHDHVTFELEAIDRMYLNAYVPSLQTGAGFVYFVKTQLGARVPSTMMVAPMSRQFVETIERFAATQGVDLVTFEKGQRKDDVAQQYLAAFEGDEGVLFAGKAQEKAQVFRTEKRRDAHGVNGRPPPLPAERRSPVALRVRRATAARRRSGAPMKRPMDAAGTVDAQTGPPRLAKRADAFRTASTGPWRFLFRNEDGTGEGDISTGDGDISISR